MWFLWDRRIASTTVHTRKTVATTARMRMAKRHCLTGTRSEASVGPGLVELARVTTCLFLLVSGKLPAATVVFW
jgi:hypothetical protein